MVAKEESLASMARDQDRDEASRRDTVIQVNEELGFEVGHDGVGVGLATFPDVEVDGGHGVFLSRKRGEVETVGVKG